MTGVGLTEWMVVGVLVLLFVGPEKMPGVARQAGRLYGKFRRAADELRRALVLEADRMDEEERLKELRKRRLDAEKERQRMAEQAGSQAQPDLGPPAPAPGAGFAPADGAGAPEDDVRPEGFTEEEWADVAPHIREIVKRRGSKP